VIWINKKNQYIEKDIYSKHKHNTKATETYKDKNLSDNVNKSTESIVYNRKTN